MQTCSVSLLTQMSQYFYIFSTHYDMVTSHDSSPYQNHMESVGVTSMFHKVIFFLVQETCKWMEGQKRRYQVNVLTAFQLYLYCPLSKKVVWSQKTTIFSRFGSSCNKSVWFKSSEGQQNFLTHIYGSLLEADIYHNIIF